jgi:thiamine pyrophosphokinase
MRQVDAAKAIIVANASIQPGRALQAALEQMSPDAPVICADGGADRAISIGLFPSLVIGDLDSIQPETLRHLEQRGVEIIRYSPRKNETDLELTLLEATARGARWIRIIGAIGDRLDQTLSNIHLLMLPDLAGRDVRLVFGSQMAWLVGPGRHPLIGQPGDTVSLVPLQGDVGGITTTGLEYPLQHETLHFGAARGVSNVLTAPEASVEVTTGVLLIIHTIGSA